MWILESETAFDGCKLWLRPGRTYLFGRTASEPGQLAISHNTISRKHITIVVDPVAEGDALVLDQRSTVTIEDLKTKLGTFINGEAIKGKKYVVATETAELILGKCPSKFILSWHPVGFTFSFTSKELRTKPYDKLRASFEQLDIKLLPEYDQQWTTHVVSKKRNTSKGLQALIHAKFIVAETFLEALSQVAERSDETPSLLEQDFLRHWPNAMLHLPPKGGEPVTHPDEIYQPDAERSNIFEGYTFVFYDKTQYENLIAPVTNGGGKALMESVKAHSTTTDDFVRYVKSVAGEKGLGSFEDGSEGRGVVLVRYLPAKGDSVDWYKKFITEVSLRLDHRPIEQSEFLEAILIKNAGILRRPLEEESPANTQELPLRDGSKEAPSQQKSSRTLESQSGPTDEGESKRSIRSRTREPVKRRFAGFDDGEDISMIEPEATSAPQEQSQGGSAELEVEGGLFVSENPSEAGSQLEPQQTSRSTRNSKKRGAPPLPEDDLMDGIAPSAERFKKQKIERREKTATTQESNPEPVNPEPKKIKKEIDILAVAAKNREAEEERARQEKEDLARLPDDVDLSEIRRLNIVEEIAVRVPIPTRSREQETADGRWNAKWNGMKNFKKFVPRGEQRGRQLAKNIITLTEVKTKEFGVGEDYWLEDDTERRKKTQQTISQPSIIEESSRSGSRGAAAKADDSDSELEDVYEAIENGTFSKKADAPQQAAASASQSNARRPTRAADSSQSKRAAAAESSVEQSSKRPRPGTRRTARANDSDDSDDDLKFKFGRRRR